MAGETGENPGQDEERPKPPAPREPKTETTLTTRVRINIPGSRPIPPVVLRTPVADTGNADSDDAAQDAPAPPAGTADATQAMPRWAASSAPGNASGAPEGPGGTSGGGTSGAPFSPPSGEKEKPPPSDWFAPRKTPPQPAAGRSGGAPGPTVPPQGPGPQPFTPQGPAAGGTPAPGFDDGTGFPGTGGGYGDGDGFGAGPRGPRGASGTQPPPNIPYLGENPPVPPPPFPGQQSAPGTRAPQAPGDPFGAGPSTGRPFGTDTPPAGTQGGAGQDTVAFPGFHHPDPALRPGGAGPAGPSGPTTGPATGAMRTPTAGGTGFPPPGGPRPGAPRSGGPAAGATADPTDTVAGGFPPVTADGTPPAAPAPSGPSQTPPPAGKAAAGKPARKGRSKPMLLIGVLVTVAAIAYGAGLLMDHADVPNGTLVLGVNIGGDSRQQAVKALNTAVGDRSTAPLKVKVGSKVVELKPELAGLSIDTQTTVDGVAHRDYNPVPVIESLFGGTHQVAPHVTVDQEKLHSQLQPLTGGTGGGSDGMVKFVDGTPVAVPGKPYQAVDEAASAGKITAAYERRAQTGVDEPVDLPVTVHQPLVTRAALTQAIKTIGDPAMSGRITVVAGGRSVPFSPQLSLSKVLTIVAVPGTGQLTLHIDLPELQTLYGTAFDGVLLERANGSKTPVTPADVASAMLPELRKTAPSKTATITNVAE
ncbi:hypothetical protein POF50_014100 [Streptomyces sp. SL13]|uniref:Peptidoglycan binding domain-containing protein n=1 Tax=Streptantibioticus silvisoli TaxID=2705255 RepID=A0AA90H4C2_9ACTN|nr:hypothetical protein [Streptantibioticus silvisoli]MDI5970459.1 hypothetical protein [Streptantibioticus silvisoli]